MYTFFHNVCVVLEFKLRINPCEILIFNKETSNGYNEFIANLTFINDYKDHIAFKVNIELYLLKSKMVFL